MAESDYRSKVRQELLASRTDSQTGFRDEWGFIDDFHDGGLKPDGEGSLHTAIAAIAIATGNFHQDEWEAAEANQRLIELLTALRDGGWGNHDGLGRTYPIRHPRVFDFNAAGESFRNSPMSKDAFGAIIAACYYAGTCPNSTTEVRDLAVSLIRKWLEFLTFSQFRTHSNFIAGEFEQDGDFYKNIFGPNGGRVKFKGPDAFLLFPHEIYALQSVGAALGEQTSDMNVWLGGMLPQLQQTIIDVAAPYVGDACRRALNSILEKLKVEIPWAIPLGPDRFHFGELRGDFDIEIPSSIRDGIARSFGDAVRDIIREMARLDQLVTNQATGLLDLAISRILDALPDFLAPDKWRSILTLAVKQISPWLDGSLWVEALTFAATLQILKRQPTFVQSYTLWPYAVLFETRPDLADLLRPIVQEFFSALRGQGNPIGMWAWLAEDTGRVDEQLTTFSTHSPYRWSSFAYGSTKYEEWLVDTIEDPELPNGMPVPTNKQSPRKDYLVLHGLAEKGAPRGVTDVAEDWLRLFRDAIGDLFNTFLADAKRTLEQLGVVAIEGLSRVEFHTDSPLIPPINIHGDAGHGDAHADIGHGDAHGDTGHGDAHGDIGRVNVHADTGHGDFHGDAGHGDAHADIPSPSNFHTDFRNPFHGDAHGDSRIEAHLDVSLSGAHGDSGLVRIHGDAGPLGVHGDSQALGLHGDSASVGLHGDSPAVGLHGDAPGAGHIDAHGDVGDGGHLDSPIIPPINLNVEVPHADLHGDAGHGDAHGDFGHGDVHGDAGHGDVHADGGHGDAHSDVGHGDAHGDVGHGLGGPHADWGGLGLHADTGRFGAHGDSPQLGVHGDVSSLGAHGDTPALGVHADSPETQVHGDFGGFGHGDVHIDQATQPGPNRAAVADQATHPALRITQTGGERSDTPGTVHLDSHFDTTVPTHQDAHADYAHTSIPPVLPHQLNVHVDTVGPPHGDSHLDVPSVPLRDHHLDVHADLAGPPHVDNHLDFGSPNHRPPNVNLHIDAAGPPHLDIHVDTAPSRPGPPPAKLVAPVAHGDAHADVDGPPHGDSHADSGRK